MKIQNMTDETVRGYPPCGFVAHVRETTAAVYRLLPSMQLVSGLVSETIDVGRAPDDADEFDAVIVSPRVAAAIERCPRPERRGRIGWIGRTSALILVEAAPDVDDVLPEDHYLRLVEV